MYSYKAKLVKVVDGDTIDVEVDLGFTVKVLQRLRFARINAPETRTRDKLEKARGLEAKQFVIDQLEANGNECVIQTEKLGKYGRYIANIYVGENRTCLNDELVAKSLAEYVEY